MRKHDIDRICAATLEGRFGAGLIAARNLEDLTRALDSTANAAATLRDAAVWTSARSGIEQGKP